MQKRINIQNKKARFEYEILDQFTAGIVLTGTEIKSIRNSKASIAESFCEFNEKGELFVVNMYIEEYAFGTRFNHRPRGSRKLLLNKRELINLSNEVKQNGYSIVPTKIYTKHSLIKLEIALAKGKKTHDKRADIKNREWERSKDRILKKR